MTTHAEWTKRCSWYPVTHKCGHYEARYMDSKYSMTSSMVCSSCDALGRNVVPSYLTQEACLQACEEKLRK